MTSNTNNIETEYKEFNKNGKWHILYQKIRQGSSNNEYTSYESVKPQNKNLNRYRDVSPYDHSRIVLRKGSTDYINANLVEVQKANRSYILTQGPLPHTVGHFWLMVWEQNTKAVLMLNKLIEKKQEKCCQYWPSEMGPDHIMKLDNVGLTLEYTEMKDNSHYLMRTLKLTDVDSGDSRDIIQFHYTTWPDFGVPSSPKAFLKFLKKVREEGALEKDVGPAVIHCSAGIGRSGTFCLVDSCLVLIEEYGYNSVDVKEVLLELRQYRMGLIQTPEQLRFSYQAIIKGAKKQDSNSNVDDHESSNEELNNHNDVEQIPEAPSSEEDDEPPPLPPPRNDSLRNVSVDRPLPNIPVSTSLSDLSCNNSDSEKESYPNGPLPVPEDDDYDESSIALSDSLLDTENPTLNKSDDESNSDARCLSPASELRQRKRVERNEQLAAQVRDMKRRQQSSEQWTQLKRSLIKPLVVSGAIAITGGLLAYFYYKA